MHVFTHDPAMTDRKRFDTRGRKYRFERDGLSRFKPLLGACGLPCVDRIVTYGGADARPEPCRGLPEGHTARADQSGTWWEDIFVLHEDHRPTCLIGTWELRL